MQQVAYLSAKSFHESDSGLEGEAHQVDDDIRTQPRHPVAENALGVLLLTIRHHLLHVLPFKRVDIAARFPRLMLKTSWPARTSRGMRKVPMCPLLPTTTTLIPLL
ncbi:hypothetical protein [Saccharopolyspora erythraea]|uniref:Uncharacterized protein n=1 Tax=Saccharopolyspora erythraea TaxID=1836 RepID=A0ABN1E6S5_SACER|nr:hypothetical protein [Saccharopolyspora erythraea]EQD82103.1 hypothetical protein N599_32495 [Saccharopolyspora erythraea D]